MLLPGAALAASDSGSSHGIKARLSTTKDEYASDENIAAKLTVTNTNSFDVKGIKVKMSIPDEMELVSGKTYMNVDLAAGESATLSVDISESSPKTGDETPLILVIAILAVSVAAAVFLLKKHIITGKSLMILIMCLALAGGVMLPATTTKAMTLITDTNERITVFLPISRAGDNTRYMIVRPNVGSNDIRIGSITGSISFAGFEYKATVQNFNKETGKVLNRISSNTFTAGTTVYLFGGELYSDFSKINFEQQSPGSTITYMKIDSITCTDANGNSIVLREATSNGKYYRYFTLPWSDVTVSFNYVTQYYKVTASINGPGKIEPSGTVQVADGKDKTFTLTPAIGCEISNVLVNGVSIDAASLAQTKKDGSYTLSSIHSDMKIEAVFAKKHYTVTATAGSGGAISPAGESSVSFAADQKYTITPEAGYEIDSVKIDGTDVDANTLSTIIASGSYTFSQVQKNYTIDVSFHKSAFTITAASGGDGGGSISPMGDVSVGYGKSQAFAITPIDGFALAKVEIDGVKVDDNVLATIAANKSYTFDNVTAPHSIIVYFVVND